MDLSKVRISLSPKVSWQRIEDKIIVVNPEERKMHILAESGTDIWECLTTPKSIDEVVTLISKEYEVDVSCARRDIQDFIVTLKDKKLVIFK